MGPTLILLLVFGAVAAVIFILDRARKISMIADYTDGLTTEPSKWVTKTGAEFIKKLQNPKNVQHLSYMQLVFTDGCILDWSSITELNSVNRKEGLKIRGFGVPFKPNPMEEKIIMNIVEKIRTIKFMERDSQFNL